MIWFEIKKLKSPRRARQGETTEEAPHRDAARAAVVRLDGLSGVGAAVHLVVQFGLLGVGDHPAGVVDTEVDVGLASTWAGRWSTTGGTLETTKIGLPVVGSTWLAASTTAAPSPWVYCRWVLTQLGEGRFEVRVHARRSAPGSTCR